MLINRKDGNNSRVKFISYNASCNNLCGGKLTLKIDGVFVRFEGYGKGNVFPKFWRSGGEISGEYEAIQREWIIDVEEIPEQYRKYAVEIDSVFNENVPYGCCGGCI